MGIRRATEVLEELGRRGLFRAKELRRRGISINWMPFFQRREGYVHHGRGVWSHPRYNPTRYELVAIRFPHAVFCGPSALWLRGELELEPAELWIAIGNKSRVPSTLDPAAVIIRSRHHKRDAELIRPAGTAITLLVHTAERARADLITRTPAPARSRSGSTTLPSPLPP